MARPGGENENMQSCLLGLFRMEEARPFTNLSLSRMQRLNQNALEDFKKSYGNQEHTMIC
jgi:hypothetical protein